MSFGNLRAHRRQLCLYFVDHGDCVRIGLTIDIQQHGRAAISTDEGVLRFNSGADRRYVGQSHGRSC